MGQKMNPLFLVSSALHTRFGVYTLDQRVSQTIDTLSSIKRISPFARIILNESSGLRSVTAETIKKLPSVYKIINHSDSQEVIRIHNAIDREDIVKNHTEMLTTIAALEIIMRDQLHVGCDRIFKLSGRYMLSVDFYKKNNYGGIELKDAIVVGAARKSQLDPYLTDDQSLQYMCRCWSFPVALIYEVHDIYTKMLSKFIEVNQQGKYLDLEHLLYMYLAHRSDIKEVSVVGVMGNIGSTGEWIVD